MSRVEVIGDATLYLGDCREMLPTLPKVDAVVTDPPYGVNLGKCGDFRGGVHGMAHEGYAGTYTDTHSEFVADIVPRINMALSRAKRALVWTGPHIHEQAKPDAIGGVFCPSATGRHVWGFKQFLPVLLYGMSPSLARGTGASNPTAIKSTEVASEDSRGHPVPKPEGWMMWSVQLASEAGETILDPFMGSGTTGVACMRLNRRFIGIEIHEPYFDIACRRIEAEHRRPRLALPDPVHVAKQEAML
jgi:site-specific DNA-methyltransferase (adenine-specific)